MNQEKVPLINLAPKIKRPLSLWNPLDYLRILFWFLFFPQAIRFYLEKYNRSIDRYKLVFQVFIITFIITFGICVIPEKLHFQMHWLYMASGIILIVALGWTFGVVRTMALGVVFGAAVGVTAGLVAGVVTGGAVGIVFGVAFGITSSMTVWYSIDSIDFKREEVLNRHGIEDIIGSCIFVGGLGGLLVGASVRVLGRDDFVLRMRLAFLAFFSTYFLIQFRFIETIIVTFYMAFFQSENKIKHFPQLGRLVFLPIPGIQKCLENQLSVNWETGVRNANQLLVYSFQFMPVIKAIKKQLYQLPRDNLLSRVSALTYGKCDDKILPVISQKSLQFYWESILTLPMSSPVEAAFSGFWLWYKKKADEAEGAFLKVRDLRHGQELYQTALVIHRGIRAGNLQSIASLEKEMNWLNALPDPELRPGTLKTLRILRSVVGEAHTACHSRSVFSRSTAIRGIFMNINWLIDTGASFCPEPEWSLVRDIALSWRVIFSSARDEINEKLLHSPSLNPYEGYSRLPVTDSTFIGRSRVIGKIENYCAPSGLAPVIVLYGQLGMGKSSVLRYLAKNKYTDNIYVYLDMQLVGWANHVGQMLLDVAEAIHKSVSQSGFDIGPAPDSALYSDFNSARRSLNSLLGRIDPFVSGKRRIILAIDEFELIETGIHGSKIDPGLLLYYLRYLNQQNRWLGLIFAGLHTLKEMGGDYWSAFHGQAQYIRIGYLTRDDTLKLITQPHPDFLLKYQDTLIDEIYRLTYGQPYLVQQLCWGLVNHWNDRFLQSGKTLPRVLKLDDLEPVLTPDFYQSSGYYFDGVWSNATPHEQTLMRILSECENKLLSRRELMAEAQKTGFPPDPLIMDEALKMLIRHDIITGDENGYHFSSELMRRWVTTAPNLH